jgi:hypothetical protein
VIFGNRLPGEVEIDPSKFQSFVSSLAVGPIDKRERNYQVLTPTLIFQFAFGSLPGFKARGKVLTQTCDSTEE